MTERELDQALAELSGKRSEGEPIVTLYLDTAWKDEKRRERARVFVQDAVKRAVDRHAAHPQLEAMRRTLGRVAQAAAEHHGQPAEGNGAGLAIFACEALGLWRVISAPRPFQDALHVDACPHLLQLARLRDDVEPALVAFVHGRGTQLYEVALGAMVAETAVEGGVPTQHGQGGRIRGGAAASPHGASGGAYYEREAKNQRHAEEQVQKVHREAAEVLRRMAEREPRAHVVLVGTAESLAEFERELPERLRARVLARLPRPPSKEAWNGSGRVQLAARVVEQVLEHERAAEARAVEHAIGEALRGGLAVLGPEDVVLAVNERRVHRLLLEEDFERSGWRCRNCRALGTTHEEVCSYCRGPLARVDALGEELMGRVLGEDGEVEIVAHSQRLHSYAGVAAVLRQAKAKGLSGRAAEAPRS
jgi:peptide subunit release factor 1 (eRF1)